MKISADKKNQAISMLMNGHYGWEISEVTGISEATITKYRKELQKDNIQLWHTKGGKVSSTLR